MTSFNRRSFLKTSGLGVLPALIPFSATLAGNTRANKNTPPVTPIIKLFGDGEMFEPGEYLNELQKVHETSNIIRDRYGSGGVVEALEKKFVEITGKEKAIFMPSGTMANQLAIAVLSGSNTKIFVQDTSHIYRDEADAAQSVFQKRLMPLAKNEAFFTAQQLQAAVEGLKSEEVFQSGVGAIAIENPVRRADGRYVPLEEIKKISIYCRANNIKMHLDGARIFMASGWTGVAVKEYASYFDTVYISLYKYFGAGGGAVLCGTKEVIDKMGHLVKVHGGNMYSNWTNAAMALHRMEAFETRLQEAINRSKEIFAALNKIRGVKITAIDNGTNIYNMTLSKKVNGQKMQEKLNKDYNIRMGRADANGRVQLTVNETLLYQTAEYVVDAFKKSMQ